MARSRRKSGGPTRGRFKAKKMGKGFSTVRQQPIGTRPVLRISDADAAQLPKKGDGVSSSDE
jgi:hypothetical protein